MLGKLHPINEKEEKRKFLTAWRKGDVYEPVFQYSDPHFCRRVVDAFDGVFYSDMYANLAEKILFDVVAEFGSAEGYRAEVWGPVIEPKQDVLKRAATYRDQHEIRANIFFGTSLVTMMSGKGLSLVSTPGYYRSIRLQSLLDHELSVHHLRSQNHRMLDKQLKVRIRRMREDTVDQYAPRGTPADIKKALLAQMVTADEEGLAAIVTNMSYESRSLKLFQPALSNYSVHLARHNGFHKCVSILISR